MHEFNVLPVTQILCQDLNSATMVQALCPLGPNLIVRGPNAFSQMLSLISSEEIGKTTQRHQDRSMELSVIRTPPVRVFSDLDLKTYGRSKSTLRVSSALAETAVSVAIAATVVGVAATILVKRTKEASLANEIPMTVCNACQGSGICPECKGEGFVLKRLSDQSSEKARLTAQNAATRYTAGLPKKWSYCSKCSSSRSCIDCGGQGKVSY